MEHCMKLHDNKKLFQEAIQAIYIYSILALTFYNTSKIQYPKNYLLEELLTHV